MLLVPSIRTFLDISQLRTRQLRDRIFFLVLYLLSFFSVGAFIFLLTTYLLALGQNISGGQGVISSASFLLVLMWTFAGLLISVLATLLSWPCALATAVVLEQESGHWAFWAQKFISWLSSLPLIVYAYIFVQFMAIDVLSVFKGLWLGSFASVNWVTQLIAFAGTLVLYPLLLFVPGTEGVTMDQFFKTTLASIIDFGEVGLTVTLLCVGLIFVILPRMTFEMQKMLKKNKDLQSLEVIRSLGGTFWESMHITIIHSMRSRFALVFVRFVRYSFFEGVIVFLLLGYPFYEGSEIETFFGTTLSSMFVRRTLVTEIDTFWIDILSLGGWLIVLHFIFLQIESYALKRGVR